MQEVAGGPASGAGESRPPCTATKSVSMSPRMEGPDKGQRGLRWTKHESLILVAAKSKELDRSLDSSAKGVDASDVKWVTIFQYCKDLGVERDASQCRKRWHSLYKDYKKIKEYEKLHGGSYWSMSAEQRREQKLASSFEHEVFEVLEDYCKKLPAVSAKATPEAEAEAAAAAAAGKEEAGAGADEVESAGNGASSEECGAGCSTDVTGCPKMGEGPTKRKKRKRRPESMEERLLAAVESTSRNLQLQIRRDREQRTEEGKDLLKVLDRLLTSVGRIADALEVRRS